MAFLLAIQGKKNLVISATARIPDEELERIKREISVAELARARDTVPAGDRLVACPVGAPGGT